MKGLTDWISKAGFRVYRLHYSADPAKDPSTPEGKRWLDNEIKGMPGGIKSAAFRREYEIDWEAAGGELVFPELGMYREKIVVRPFEVPETWNLFAGFDYGHRNPSSFHVYAIDYDENMWVVCEYYKSGEGYRKIASAIWNCGYYQRLACAPIADPSIWAVTQNTDNEVKSLATLFCEIREGKDEEGNAIGPIVFMPGRKGGDVTVAEKIQNDFWKDLHQREPRLKIFATCPMMVWELEKLRYAEWTGTLAMQRNKREALVDRDNHSWDDLKVVMTQFFMGPDKPAVPLKYERLKETDPISYNEWKRYHEAHDGKKQATLGEW